MAFNQSLTSGVSEQEVEDRNEGSEMCVSPGNHLPQEIILNILSRLPVESVLQCRRVCKTWRYLPKLDSNNITYFTDMHLRHQPRQFQRDYKYHHNNNNQYSFDSETKMSFVLLGKYPSLYFVEYDENNEQSYSTHKRMNLPHLPADISSLVGSCNGLICFSVQRKCYTHDPVYICNPITQEIVHLPRFILNDKHRSTDMAYGFGYHPSTNVYKVVRVYYCLDQQPSVGQVQVYTLGSGIGWRSKGEITHPLEHARHGVLLNGVLHWLSTERNIVAFDLADEEFRCIPTPPCSFANSANICVLGGWLCVVVETSRCTADIWLLKKSEKQSMSSDDDRMKEQVYQSWSWSREFKISINRIDQTSQPFAITKSGGILLWYKGKTIVCCGRFLPSPKNLGELHKDIDGNQAISHFNSFVSLKRLGENAEIL